MLSDDEMRRVLKALEKGLDDLGGLAIEATGENAANIRSTIEEIRRQIVRLRSGSPWGR